MNWSVRMRAALKFRWMIFCMCFHLPLLFVCRLTAEEFDALYAMLVDIGGDDARALSGFLLKMRSQ
jgi:hypothetical protein